MYVQRARGRAVERPGAAADWPLHDIAMTNIEWCIAYQRGLGGGGEFCEKR